MLPALLLSLLAPAGAPGDPGRPDVLIVVLDDVADSDVDVIPTPTLDALAAEGVRFRRAYAHTWCSPTRDALLFGEWLADFNGDDCVPGPRTRDLGAFSLADLFEGQGYRTCHLGKWHLGANEVGPFEVTPHLVGFDDVRASIPIGTCNVPDGEVLVVNDGVATQDARDDSIRQRDAFLAWWNEHADGPRLAVVNLMAAHWPFRRPPGSILPPGYVVRGQTNRALFEAEVVAADFVLAQMLAVVPDDAWVIVLGDNGTPGERNGSLEEDATRPDQDPRKVKLSAYEDGVRVPLIVRAPGTLRGHESDALVHVVDVLPTLGDVLGQPVRTDGASFLPALRGGTTARPWVFCWGGEDPTSALITARWKLLVNAEGREHLFDLARDPREEAPLPPLGHVADKLRAYRAEVLGSGDAPGVPRASRR